MGSSSVEDAKRWLRQHISIPDRVASLIMRCAEGGMKPSEIKMSPDLFIQMIEAAAKSLGQKLDPKCTPTTLSISLGDHELTLIQDEKMPWASMRATKQ